jgi:DNA-binding NarL/FixJ family response regulator
LKAPIRVLTTDDHAIVRHTRPSWLTAPLATERDMKVVGEPQDGQEAVEKAGSLQPDVVLMDLVMPRMDGIEATRKITEAHPEVKVLVLSLYQGRQYEARAAGADLFVSKSEPPERLLCAVFSLL